MADKDGPEGDNLSAPADESDFSHLLFSDDKFGLIDGVDGDYSIAFSAPHFLEKKPPKMVSFGNFQNKLVEHQKFGISCPDSSSSSSYGNDCDMNALRLANAKRSGHDFVAISQNASPERNRRTSKKIKSDNPTLTSHPKASVELLSGKEKLGERVATLQQLVSPFGKTDTSSVLHEAMGYIKFLHEQVQVLCCPYFQSLPFLSGNKSEKEEAEDRNLRSRGLCLVPVETTLNMANNNGADLWLPGMKQHTITKH